MPRLEFLPKSQKFLESTKNEVIFSGGYGSSKAQPLNSKILTPTGWVLMSDLKIGDEIINSNGLSTTVINIQPRGILKTYRVFLSDGSYTRCSEDHLWSVWTNKTKTRNRPNKILDTKSIKNDLLRSNGYPKYFVPMVDPVRFIEQSVEIEPYLLGLLLGDGCFRNWVRFTTSDPELIDYIKDLIPEDLVIIYSGKFEYKIRNKIPFGKNQLKDHLKLMKLWDKKSAYKFIPKHYKYNSIKVRYEILKGLFDTDGTNHSIGCVGYTTKSPQLALDVQEIVQSLGGRCNIGTINTHYKKNGIKIDCGKAYSLYISLPNEFPPFKLKRKLDKWSPNRQRLPTRGIVSIEEDGYEESQCIKVSAENGLYVTDQYIVTHNSVSLCAKAVFLSLRYPRNRGFLGRKYLQAFKATTYKTLLEGDGNLPPILPKEYILSHNKTDRSIILKNLSEILYGPVEVEQIKSLNLGWAGIDECGELTSEEWDALNGRLRLGGIPIRMLFGSTNPYSPYHWIWNRFKVNTPKDKSGNSTVELIQSATYENHFLPTEYIENLKRTLFGHYYQRYIVGDWVGADTLVFDNFNLEIHQRKPFIIPKHWKRYRAIDFGYRSPYVCCWFAICPEDNAELDLSIGDVILYREYYYTQKTSTINAQKVKDLSVYPDGSPERIEWTVCDWDAGDRADLESVGIKTIKADKKDKLSRINKVRQKLGNTNVSLGTIVRPVLYILENSLVEIDKKIRFNMETGESNNNPTRAIEEFMAYGWKPSKNGQMKEEPQDEFDHSMDTIGYFFSIYDSIPQWAEVPFMSL